MRLEPAEVLLENKGYCSSRAAGSLPSKLVVKRLF
jgi:hypothetical protein